MGSWRRRTRRTKRCTCSWQPQQQHFSMNKSKLGTSALKHRQTPPRTSRKRERSGFAPRAHARAPPICTCCGSRSLAMPSRKSHTLRAPHTRSIPFASTGVATRGQLGDGRGGGLFGWRDGRASRVQDGRPMRVDDGGRVSRGVRRRSGLVRSKERCSDPDTSESIGCQPVDSDGLSRVTPCPLRASQVVDGRQLARHERRAARRAASVAAAAAALVASAAFISFCGPKWPQAHRLVVACVGWHAAARSAAVRWSVHRPFASRGPRRARVSLHACDAGSK